MAETPDWVWRREMLDWVHAGEPHSAAQGLLALALNDPDAAWIEDILIGVVEGDSSDELRQLALICFGHVARLHRRIQDPRTRPLLDRYQSHPRFTGVVGDVFDDLAMFLD